MSGPFDTLRNAAGLLQQLRLLRPGQSLGIDRREFQDLEVPSSPLDKQDAEFLQKWFCDRMPFKLEAEENILNGRMVFRRPWNSKYTFPEKDRLYDPSTIEKCAAICRAREELETEYESDARHQKHGPEVITLHAQRALVAGELEDEIRSLAKHAEKHEAGD